MDGDTIRQVFLLLVGLTYIGLGIFMFIKKVIPVSPWGDVISVIFVVYGSWRTYRAIMKK